VWDCPCTFAWLDLAECLHFRRVRENVSYMFLLHRADRTCALTGDCLHWGQPWPAYCLECIALGLCGAIRGRTIRKKIGDCQVLVVRLRRKETGRTFFFKQQCPRRGRQRIGGQGRQGQTGRSGISRARGRWNQRQQL